MYVYIVSQIACDACENSLKPLSSKDSGFLRCLRIGSELGMTLPANW